jgi:hypothetical protein
MHRVPNPKNMEDDRTHIIAAMSDLPEKPMCIAHANTNNAPTNCNTNAIVASMTDTPAMLLPAA